MVSVLNTVSTNQFGTFAPSETKDLVVRTALRQSKGFDPVFPIQLSGYISPEEWAQEIELINKEFRKSSCSTLGCLLGTLLFPIGGCCYLLAANGSLWEPRVSAAISAFNSRIQPKGLASRLNENAFANCWDCIAACSQVEYRIEVFVKSAYQQQQTVSQNVPVMMPMNQGGAYYPPAVLPMAPNSGAGAQPLMGTQAITSPAIIDYQQQLHQQQLMQQQYPQTAMPQSVYPAQQQQPQLVYGVAMGQQQPMQYMQPMQAAPVYYAQQQQQQAPQMQMQQPMQMMQMQKTV